ncbi:TolB-like 6-bladed beta-propeller domain-containing protein [Belliella sp. R4-6]|uniref:TolB-like 6-bladed beta-propeller domain-containing protein n=1 Tax=Belliella alkalica TaxID=1730871 RepID=A0ABS9VCX9_9BACT|nr:BF3164 family lipoprotein [Belliella alkalica]MCH7414305.1 TolB-like 6-bladed beta-propeller domain-containing protein [Belliella alkalica]
MPSEQHLQGNKLNLERLGDARRIFFKEGKLVVAEKSNTYQLHIFAEPDFNKVSAKGYNGYGPGELTNVWKMEDRGEPGKFWAYDLEQKSYYRFDLNDTNILADKEYSRLEPFFFVSEMAWASDSSIWARMVDKDDQYFELALSGDTIAKWGKWQDYADRPDTPSSVLASLHSGKMHVNLDKRIGVIAGVSRDYIEIVNLNTLEKIQLFGPENAYPEYEVSYSTGYPMPIRSSNNKTYYFDNFPGEEYIYLSYFGEQGNKRSDINPKLILLNYHGEIKKVFQLDKPIVSMAIDEENNRVFGLSYEKEPGVYLYNLPPSLEK